MYDNCEGGKRNWSSASSYCSSKGMRLPSTNETRAYVSNGVPSCGSWTWTSTDDNYGISYYDHIVWNGTSLNGNYDSYSGYVRCVK